MIAAAAGKATDTDDKESLVSRRFVCFLGGGTGEKKRFGWVLGGCCLFCKARGKFGECGQPARASEG